jgi:hypothetical protein
MDTVSELDHVAHADSLRAFIDAMSDLTGASANVVIQEMAMLLERQLRRRSDDIDQVYRLGRLLQAVRLEFDAAGAPGAVWAGGGPRG